MVASVFISSSKSLLLNFYRFQVTWDLSKKHTFNESSLNLSRNSDKEHVNDDRDTEAPQLLRTSCIFPLPLEILVEGHEDHNDNDEDEALKTCVQFYQLLALSEGLELSSTIFERQLVDTADFLSARSRDLQPVNRAKQPNIYKSAEHVTEPFIAPDRLEDELDFYATGLDLDAIYGQVTPKTRLGNGQRPKLNWNLFFDLAFADDSKTLQQSWQSESDTKSDTMMEVVERVADSIEQGKRQDGLRLSTLLVLACLY